MAVDRNDVDEQQARLDRIIADFRAVRQRLRVKQGIALWNRTEEALGGVAQAEPPPRKLN